MISSYDDSNLNLDIIPRLDERKDSLDNQLQDVIKMCNQAGCWKAADFIQEILSKDSQKLV